MRIDFDRDGMHAYREALLAGVPSDFIPHRLYETMEYYLINASEDERGEDERRRFVKTASGIGVVIESLFGIPNAIPGCIRVE